MGVTGASEFEKWLALSVSPTAFYYALPSNFTASLVTVDLSAVTVSSFTSKKTITADDMVTSALWSAREFLASNEEGPIVESVSERKSLNGCARVGVSNPPSVESIKERAREKPFPAATHDATLVYSLDDSRFLPIIRHMTQEDRYKNKRVVEEEELAKKQWHVFGSLKLPGDFPEDPECVTTQQKAERSAAMATPAVRKALRVYLPWAMMSVLVSETRCLKCCDHPSSGVVANIARHSAWNRSIHAAKLYHQCLSRGETKQALAHKALSEEICSNQQPDLECTCNHNTSITGCGMRRIVIDAVPKRLEVDSAHLSVESISDEFYKNTSRATHLFEMRATSARPVKWRDQPSIGESDLKLIYYITKYSKKGDDVLVKNADSDVLYALLLNAHRFIDEETGEFTRRIFLDQYHGRFSDSRMYRRYVCINQLYSDISAYAEQRWSLPKTGPVPHGLSAVTVLSALVFFGVTDYTKGIAGVGPKKRIAVLENDSFMRSVTNMFGHIDVNRHGAHLASSVAICLSLDFRIKISMQCIIETMSAAARNHHQNAGPAKQHDYVSVCSAIEMTGGKTKVPKMDHLVAMWSRISWALTYMANAPLNCGVVPSPTALCPEGKPLWGWTMALRSHTCGEGAQRLVLESQWRTIFEEEHKNDTSADAYVPALDDCIASPGPVVLQQVGLEVSLRRDIGSSCHAREIMPPWAFSALSENDDT